MSPELMDRLRALPPQLPDVADRAEQVRRLARRRRRSQLAAAAAGVALVAVVPAVLVPSLSGGPTSHPAQSRRPTPPPGLASCRAPGLAIQALPSSQHMAHSPDQARTALVAGGREPGVTQAPYPALVTDPAAAKSGLGSATAQRPMWAIYRVVTVHGSARATSGHAVPRSRSLAGVRVAEVTLVDDASLAPAGSFPCGPVSAAADGSGYGIADGTRVAVSGTVAAAGTGWVLCFEAGVQLSLGPGQSGPVCADQIALAGHTSSLAAHAGDVRGVTGTWRGGVVDVESVGPAKGEDEPVLADPPCPRPPGGWAHVAPSKTPNLDFTAFERYRSSHPGVVTAVASFRPAELTPVLTVASVDPATTRAALQDAYPAALCVVRSRYTVAEVHAALNDVHSAFTARLLPGVYGFGSGVGDDGQPTVVLEALSDRAELHAALSNVPAGLLVVDAWIRAVPASS